MLDQSGESERVCCIHGTGNPEAPRSSPKWWEPESSFGNRLRAALGGNFSVGDWASVDISNQFTWSGGNSEQSRRAAGIKLLNWLIESNLKNYHLVGHSHGGSVIWHALHEAEKRGIVPNDLRTWTTIGTPFLTFAPSLAPLWMVPSLLLFLFFGLDLLTHAKAISSAPAMVLRDLPWTWFTLYFGLLALFTVVLDHSHHRAGIDAADREVTDCR
jgi:hypothetical protein